MQLQGGQHADGHPECWSSCCGWCCCCQVAAALPRLHGGSFQYGIV